MKILLSGFAPFGGDRINSSWEAVRRLDGEQLPGGIVLLATQLPVTYSGAAERFIASIQAIDPDLILAIGQASGRSQITPEVQAVNRCDHLRLDNEGQTGPVKPIIADGEKNYFSTLPVEAIADSIRKQGILSVSSQSAGTFVCNYLFYRLMHYMSQAKRKVRAGFIHVPCLPEQAIEAPALSLEQIILALKEAARVSAAAASRDSLQQVERRVQ
ncbi:MAG: pyroglutamyl-peptidase I [Sporolactobacillus sp.]